MSNVYWIAFRKAKSKARRAKLTHDYVMVYYYNQVAQYCIDRQKSICKAA